MAINVLKRLAKIFQRTPSAKDGNHTVLNSQQHQLNHKKISKHACEVIRVLQKNNFEAYAVGGCVRDLLLDLNPKDFDIATNATPQQVKRLFRRSRIVGRRFQIVHVQFGRVLRAGRVQELRTLTGSRLSLSLSLCLVLLVFRCRL